VVTGVRVLIVAEYYPRRDDPARGVWVHRQALAARDAGAEVRVLVLHRPLPPLAALRRRDLAAARRELRQPARTSLDGIEAEFVRYLSPPRPWSYASWGAWAAPALALGLRRLRREFGFDLIHAHYAVPAGDAVRRAAPGTPLVVSVHGHDVFGAGSGGPAVTRTLAHARLTLANSAGTAARCTAAGARQTRVVHLGTDLPDLDPNRAAPEPPTLVTVAHLAARKRHADVLEAIARLRPTHPELRYVIAGDGPERSALVARAAALGVARQIEWLGPLTPAAAREAARTATLFVMPSVDEAFGVAYIEAMAGRVPAIGCRGEAGPEEIAAAGGGITLVGPRDPESLAGAIGRLLADPAELELQRAAARATVEREFSWERCGRETLSAYAEALR
jgi:glycosyltransferase involved in cell wall biosynthesis